MKKPLIIFTTIIFFVSSFGYMIMENMRETNVVWLKFETENTPVLKDLRVNLTVYKHSRPSRWYGYEKIVTVIDQGKVLTDLKEKYVGGYDVEATSKLNNAYFLDGLVDNIYARVADYGETYSFKKDGIKIETILKDGFVLGHNASQSHAKYENKQTELKFFDPYMAKYQITDMTADSLNWLKNRLLKI